MKLRNQALVFKYAQIAMDIDPNDYQPYHIMATAYLSLKENDKVIELLNKGIKLNSQNAQKDTQHAEPKQLDDTLEELNQRMQAWSTGLKFSMDEDAQRLVVSVVDTATGDVIRTVPSDAVLKVAKMIVQMQGQMVDTKV